MKNVYFSVVLTLVMTVLSPVAVAQGASVAAITLDGPVDPASQEYLVRAIKEANAQKHELILIRVDTPGGMVDSMEDISQAILGSRIPVAVWVGPHGARAASAGFILLMTADVAAMSQGTRTGAAHPVMAIGGLFPIGDQQTGHSPEPETARESSNSAQDSDTPEESDRDTSQPTKQAAPNDTGPAVPGKLIPDNVSSVLMDKIGNDMKAFVRSITTARDRNPAQAVQAVSVSRSWSESEALDAGLIEVIAADESDLLKQLHNRPVKRIDGSVTTPDLTNPLIVEMEMTAREKVLTHVVNPNVAFVLLLLGILLVYIEVTHFGLVIPGVTGLACLAVAVSGLSLLPLNASGVLMLVAGIGLLIAEAFVTSFGLLAILGVVTMAIGGIILVDVPRIEGVGLDPVIAISAAIGFGIIVLVLTRLVIRAFKTKPSTGGESLIGKTAQVVKALDPDGSVLINGEYWAARCEHPVGSGQKVVVTAVDGLILVVDPEKPKEV